MSTPAPVVRREVFDWQTILQASEDGEKTTRHALIRAAFGQYINGPDLDLSHASPTEMRLYFQMFHDAWVICESFINT